MAQNTYVAVGNTEDMSPIITNIAPSDTPIMSAIGRSRATAVFHSWLEDDLGVPGENAQAEGGALTADNPTPRQTFGNWTQIMQRGYQVTGTQEMVAKQGVKSELAYQMQKAAKEIALDEEWAIINNTGAVIGGTYVVSGVNTDPYGVPTAGAMTTGIRKFTGLPTWIQTNAIAAGGALTEDLLNQAIQAVWAAGGTPKKAFMSPSNKRVASTFSNPDRTVDQHDKRLTRAIRFYESDFGVIEMVPHRLLDDAMVLILDPSYIKFADLRPVHPETIAKTTDSVNRVLLGEMTLEVRAEKAHAKLTGVTVAATQSIAGPTTFGAAAPSPTTAKSSKTSAAAQQVDPLS